MRPGYKGIRIKLKVKGDAPKEKLEELARIAERRSTVADVVAHGTPLEVTIEQD